MNIIYTLKVTSNKRKLIYINDELIKTEPYNYNEIEAHFTPHKEN